MPRTVTSLLAPVLLALALSGCFRHHIIVDDRPAQTSAPRFAVDRYFVLGIVRIGGNLPVQGVCRTGVARIHQSAGFMHFLVSALTAGVITSRSAAYACLPASAGAHLPRAPMADPRQAPQ
jgi:hypothetical protein